MFLIVSVSIGLCGSGGVVSPIGSQDIIFEIQSKFLIKLTILGKLLFLCVNRISASVSRKFTVNVLVNVF